MPPVADRNLGNSVGAIESVARGSVSRTPVMLAAGVASASPFHLVHPGPLRGVLLVRFGARVHDSYLVDSASSHMLVSKIKPCMSKYKQLYRETANGSLNQLSFI